MDEIKKQISDILEENKRLRVENQKLKKKKKRKRDIIDTFSEADELDEVELDSFPPVKGRAKYLKSFKKHWKKISQGIEYEIEGKSFKDALEILLKHFGPMNRDDISGFLDYMGYAFHWLMTNKFIQVCKENSDIFKIEWIGPEPYQYLITLKK